MCGITRPSTCHRLVFIGFHGGGGGAGEGNRAGLRFIFLSSLWFCEKQEGAEGHIGCLC